MALNRCLLLLGLAVFVLHGGKVHSESKGANTRTEPPALYGFALTPGETTHRVITPTGTLTLDLYWDETATVTLSALLDDATVLVPTVTVQARQMGNNGRIFQGHGSVTVSGSSLAIGRHVLNITAEPSGLASTTLAVEIYNQEPISGLTVLGADSLARVYFLVNAKQVTVQASVTTGLELTADWLSGLDDLTYQTYSATDKVTSLTTAVSSPPTDFELTLIVFNEQNAETSTVTARFINPINGITTNANVTANANTNIQVSLNYDAAMNLPIGEVNYTVSYGDGSVDAQGTLVVVAGGSSAFNHVYTVQGDYNITFNLTSQADNLVLQVPAYIWDDLSGVGMTVGPTVGKPGDTFTVTITAPPVEGIQYTLDIGEAGASQLANAPSALYADYSPPALTFSYTLPGTMNVTLTVFNGMYEKVNNFIVTIQLPLTSDQFMLTLTQDVVLIPDGVAEVTVNTTGQGPADCHWDFGQGGGPTAAVTYLLPDELPITISETYGTPGNYSIIFQCSNLVSTSISHPANVTLRDWAMSDIAVDVVSMKVMDEYVPAEDVVFALSLLTFASPPTGVSANIQYGDSVSDIFTLTQWNITYRYASRGVYDGSITLMHTSRGSALFPFQIRQGAFQVTQPAQLAGLVETQLFNFSVQIPGDNFTGQVTVDFGDGSPLWSYHAANVLQPATIDISHAFIQVGDFNVTLVGQSTDPNNLYTETVTFSGPIQIDGVVDSTLVSTVDTQTVNRPPGRMYLTVTLTRPQHMLRYVECQMDFKEVLDPAVRTWNGSFSPGQSFSVEFIYQTLAVVTVQTTCQNTFSSFSTPIIVEVVNNPCFEDEPMFDREYGDKEHGMVVRSSVETRLSIRTTVHCTAVKPSFLWTIRRLEVDDDGREAMREVNITQPHADYLVIRPGRLAPGKYRVRSTVGFGPEYDNVSISESTYLRVIRDPIFAIIQGGLFRLTGDPHTLIDGYTLSYDREAGMNNKTGLSYSWECCSIDSQKLQGLTSLSREEKRPRLRCPRQGDSRLRSSTCSDFSTEVSPGVRQLNVPSSVSAAGYLFKLRVSSGYAKSLRATSVIQFDRLSFDIEIRCLLNCDQKLTVSSRANFKIVCHTCSDSVMLDASYNWNISIYDNSTEDFIIVNADDYFITSARTVDIGQAMMIGENRLQQCARYQLSVDMTLKDGTVSEAGLEFLTNCQPTSGTCVANPTSGEVLSTRFEMKCSNWIDEGFSDPTGTTDDNEVLVDEDNSTLPFALFYRFMLRKNSISVPIYEGAEASMPKTKMPLIPGQEGDDYELVTRIYDSLGEYSEVAVTIYLDTSNVTSLSSAGSWDEFLNVTVSSWEEQAPYTKNASSLRTELTQLTTVASHLLSYKLPDTNGFQKMFTNTSTKTVVNQGWTDLFSQQQQPASDHEKQAVRELTTRFARRVHERGAEAEELTCDGVIALGEAMTSVLYNPDVVSDEVVLDCGDIAERGSAALRRLSTSQPYPMGVNFQQAVFSMLGFVGNVIGASLPSYDLSQGSHLLFLNLSEEEGLFLRSRAAKPQAADDKRRAELSQAVMPQLLSTLSTMLDTMVQVVVLGSPPVQVERGFIALTAAKLTTRSVENMTIPTGRNTGLQMKLGDRDRQADTTIDVKVTVFGKNPLAWAEDGSSAEITSEVVRINITDNNGLQILPKQVTVAFKRNANSSSPVPQLNPFSSEDSRGGPDGWLYHPLISRSSAAAVVTQFRCPPGVTQAVAYFRSGRAPTKDRYDVRVEGVASQSRRRRRAAAGNGTMAGSEPTLEFFAPTGSLQAGVVWVGFELPELEGSNETVQYEQLAFSDTCRVWNDALQTWQSDGCKVSSMSSPYETICICDDAPGLNFASSFFVAPNTIDFSAVFSKFDANNASVYGTLIGIFVIWVLAVVWSRHKDKEDQEKWLVGYLKDNLAYDSHFYLMTVYTGIRKGAGTLSNVRFILTGSDGDSEVRSLTDGIRTLDTGSVMTYVMATTESLGELEHIRVWHDDSGPWDYATWYLSRITFEDLHTGCKFNFICEKWLARDREDGLIDRTLYVTSKDDVSTFNQLFTEHTRVGITDTHLWLSCFMRPERSSFTRVQRVSCCLALLLLTMITSAMFFKAEDNETGESANQLGMEVRVGFLRFSLTTMWTSFVSVVITSIPMILFVTLFRSYRPKKGPRTKAESNRGQTEVAVTKASKEEVLQYKITQALGRLSNDDKNMSDLLDNKLQENPLPLWSVYISWFLLLGTMATCAFFLILYSMQWGPTTSEEWLTAFVMSFFESIFLMDPVKVLVLACLFAYCASNPFFNTQHQHVDLSRVHKESTVYGTDVLDFRAVPPEKVSERTLEKIRQRRQHELQAQQVFFELVLYIFFVFCVFSVSYGNRDSRAFNLNTHINTLFFSKDVIAEGQFPFDQIQGREDSMTFFRDMLMPIAFPWLDQFDKELPWRQRLFTNDFTSFRLGPVRIRQVRMPKREEELAVATMYTALKHATNTYPPYESSEQETGSFCTGWRRSACTDEEKASLLSASSWEFTDDVINAPVWGAFASYPTSGYVADFSVNWEVANLTLTELENGVWIDLQTRAVFVEFALYNPDTNLFTFVRLAAEFPETGSAVTWKELKTLRLHDFVGAMGAYTLICQVITVILVLVLTVKSLLKIKKQRTAYFNDPWQALDLCILLWAYVAIVFFAIKMVAVNEVMGQWRNDPHTYVDFYLPVLWDDIYGYLLAALVFVVTVRILRVLGYNKRITAIATVLNMSYKDLFGFSIIFFIIVSAYMTAGFIFFGPYMYEFRSVWNSYWTLFLVLLGKNALGIIDDAAPVYNQAYYLTLCVLVILILVTMFQAILCNSATVVRSDVSNLPPAYGLTNIVGKFMHTISDWLPRWMITRSKIGEAYEKKTAVLESGLGRSVAGVTFSVGLARGMGDAMNLQAMNNKKKQKLARSEPSETSLVLSALSDHIKICSQPQVPIGGLKMKGLVKRNSKNRLL